MKHISLGTWTKDEVEKVLAGGNKVSLKFVCLRIESREEVVGDVQS